MENKNIINIETARRRKTSSKDSKKIRKKAEKKPLSPRMKKKRNRRRLMIAVIVLFLAVTVGGIGVKIVYLKMENKNLRVEQEALIEKRKALKTEKKNVNSLDYIEQKAREQLHLVLPGEILYVLPQDE